MGRKVREHERPARPAPRREEYTIGTYQFTLYLGDRTSNAVLEQNISAFPLNFTDFGGLGST